MTNPEMVAAMKSNEARIARQYKKLQEQMDFLKSVIDNKDWRGRGESITDGYFSRDVATMTALIGKQQTFVEISFMEEE